jgi:hypothetical protein
VAYLLRHGSCFKGRPRLVSERCAPAVRRLKLSDGWFWRAFLDLFFGSSFGHVLGESSDENGLRGVYRVRQDVERVVLIFLIGRAMESKIGLYTK